MLAAGLLVIVCSWAISWIFAFFGVIARTASSVQGISLLILFPLTFLSNAFVPVETMPDWLQWFVNVNPVTHIVTAVRDLTNGVGLRQLTAGSLCSARRSSCPFSRRSPFASTCGRRDSRPGWMVFVSVRPLLLI